MSSDHYIPPTQPEGANITPGEEPELYPGVRGIAIRRGDTVYIPFIWADKPNQGDVGRFLDCLHPSCVFVNIVSSQLRSMLRNRGWKERQEVLDIELGPVDVWYKPIPQICAGAIIPE